MRLLEYAANTFSQTGEDGIIAKILELLPVTDKWCVEFGAWDGQLLSNTCNLIQNHGYSAVLIESDKARFADLVKRFGGNPGVTGVNKFVGFTPEDGLDSILAGTPIPKDFDFLSVDIDGNDYHAWDAVSKYTPKVVCVEFNQTIPTEVEYVQAANPEVSQGSSLLAFTLLGKRKGYELVAVTTQNAIFVLAQYFPLFGINDNSPATLREDLSFVTYVFSGYDGTVFFRGNGQILWHGIRHVGRIRKIQSFFRGNPLYFSPIKNLLFRVYRKTLYLLGRA